MAEFWFEVANTQVVVGADGATRVGEVQPGKRYKAIDANEHWVTMRGPDGQVGYVLASAISRLPDEAIPPPPPPVADTPPPPVTQDPTPAPTTPFQPAESPAERTQEMPTTAAPATGTGDPVNNVLKRPLTAIAGALVLLSGFAVDWLDGSSAGDVPLKFLYDPEGVRGFDDGIAVSIVLIVAGIAILVGAAMANAQGTTLAIVGGAAALAMCGLLIVSLIRLEIFDQFTDGVSAGYWMSAVGGVAGVVGAAKR